MDGLACFVIGLGLLIYLLGGAAVVRTAVAVANRLLGPPADEAARPTRTMGSGTSGTNGMPKRRNRNRTASPRRAVPEP